MRTTTVKTLSLAAISLLLLTGCGAQEDLSTASGSTAPSASSTITTSASADPTENTEATGEATAPTEAAAEATASETQNYSGGSEAPEGEYRPADEFGPAQNVPKPVEPEGMNVESEGGLFKFLSYWNQAVNYGVETGDFTAAKSLIGPGYSVDQEFYAWAQEVYNRGGWIVGGRRQVIVSEDLLVAHGNGRYTWAGNLNVETIQPFLDGPGAQGDGSIDEGIYFDVSFSDGKWQLNNVKPIES